MKRLFDKLIIWILSIFAMSYIMQGRSLVIYIYIAIIASAIEYYLLFDEPGLLNGFSLKPRSISNLKWSEKIAVILENIFVLCIFPIPLAILFLPTIMYDIIRNRNYIGLGISIIAITKLFLNSSKLQFLNADNQYIYMLFIISLVLISIYLSLRSDINIILEKKYKKLRDDTTQTNELLRIKNKELLNTKDKEIYTAQLAERNRIAREIHDNVGHMLSRALLQTGALLTIHKKDENLYLQLDELRNTLDTAMNNIRYSIHDLHDESIDVENTIRQMSKPLSEKFNVNLEIDISDNMPRNVKYVIIGITKECISNIIKHSKSDRVDIKLNEHPSMYQLIIHDYKENEKSMDKKEFIYSGDGMGLENIKYRVESVDGILNISTDNGFRVFVSIPIK